MLHFALLVVARFRRPQWDNGISCVPCSASEIASNTNVVSEELRNYGLLHFACNFARVSTQRRSQIIGTRPFLRPPLGVQAQEHLLESSCTCLRGPKRVASYLGVSRS